MPYPPSSRLGLCVLLACLALFSCGQLTEGGGIFVTAEIDLAKRLSPDLELQVFRIVQEPLSNAAKYAGAHAAKVNLVEHNGVVNRPVLDNGRGFYVNEKLAAKASFGLHTLLERGKALPFTCRRRPAMPDRSITITADYDCFTPVFMRGAALKFDRKNPAATVR